MKPKTIWEARDRQGLKWFKRRPRFLALHDILDGERCDNLKSARVIRRFTVDVDFGHSTTLLGFYPKRLKVRP